MLKRFLLVFYGVCMAGWSTAQISPPGLGVANTAQWVAVGLRESLDSSGSKQSVTYFGLGRISHPDNLSPIQKPAILVVNQEFYHQFSTNWQYSIALSYRSQREYNELPPFESASPSTKQEFRVYGRITHLWKSARIKLASTFRQETRWFFHPDFSPTHDHLQLRSRFRTHMAISLGHKKIHRLITSAEVLFSASHMREAVPKWSTLSYKESRFCMYYSYAPPKTAFILDIGYMYDLIGMEEVVNVHYICMDIVWENPIKKWKQKKARPAEGLE